MKKYVFILIAVVSFAFLAFSVVKRVSYKKSVPTKRLYDHRTEDGGARGDVAMARPMSEKRSVFGTAFGFINEIASFIGTVLGIVLAMREILKKRKKKKKKKPMEATA